jgi:hypothetical protein
MRLPLPLCRRLQSWSAAKSGWNWFEVRTDRRFFVRR